MSFVNTMSFDLPKGTFSAQTARTQAPPPHRAVVSVSFSSASPTMWKQRNDVLSVETGSPNLSHSKANATCQGPDH